MGEDQVRGSKFGWLSGDRVPRPVNLAGILQTVILGIIALIWAVYLFTPSEIQEYRVRVQDGLYQVRAVVHYGRDFVSYQTTDGKEAIQVCTEMNAEIMKDRGGVLRASRVISRR